MRTPGHETVSKLGPRGRHTGYLPKYLFIIVVENGENLLLLQTNMESNLKRKCSES